MAIFFLFVCVLKRKVLKISTMRFGVLTAAAFVKQLFLFSNPRFMTQLRTEKASVEQTFSNF